MWPMLEGPSTTLIHWRRKKPALMVSLRGAPTRDGQWPAFQIARQVGGETPLIYFKAIIIKHY